MNESKAEYRIKALQYLVRDKFSEKNIEIILKYYDKLENEGECIYLLVDQNNVPFYIGRSKCSYKRYIAHLTNPAEDKDKQKYIRKIIEDGGMVYLCVIRDGLIDNKIAGALEGIVYRHAKECGYNFINKNQSTAGLIYDFDCPSKDLDEKIEWAIQKYKRKLK